MAVRVALEGVHRILSRQERLLAQLVAQDDGCDIDGLFDDLRYNELVRALVVQDAADELGLPAGPTLAELADACSSSDAARLRRRGAVLRALSAVSAHRSGRDVAPSLADFLGFDDRRLPRSP